MMKFSPDDPILTAFVLGELDPSEFSQVESAVLADPALQRAVSDLRGLQESLVFELVVEPELELMREQRKEILAIGRAELLAQNKRSEAAESDALASGILDGIGAATDATEDGIRRIGSFRMVAMSGLVAACVALTVSWVASQWKAGSFSHNDKLAIHRHEPAVFANSDVEGFNEPGVIGAAEVPAPTLAPEPLAAGPEVPEASIPVAGEDALEQPEVAASSGVAEIPRREDILLDLNEEVYYGVGIRNLETFSRLPRAERSLSDLDSRLSDSLPEPPDGAENIGKIETRSVEMPYKWTGEYWSEEIPPEIDTVSYSNVRRYLRQGKLPPQNSVRIEEMVNYFDYDFKPSNDGMFGVEVERAICPWNPDHQLVRVAVHACAADDMTIPRNYVFLIDSSGSMRNPARLGMLSESAGQLVDSFGVKDRVTIFTYEGDSAQLVAGPLTGDRHDAIRHAFANLDQSRSLAGTPIRVAFRAARNALIASGENRVVLISDANVEAGAGSTESLVELAKLGNNCKIGLTVAGVDGGTLDATLLARLEMEADVETHYLDGAGDAARFFGKVLAKPAKVLADRVSINVGFDPGIVRSFRLIGLANRPPVDSFDRPSAAHSNVRDGYALTALYEIIPMAAPVELNEMGDDGSWAQRETERALASALVEPGVPLMKISLRYAPVGAKLPKQTILEVANEKVSELSDLSPDFQFAAAVAGYGMMLRESPYRGTVTTEMVRKLAEKGLAFDPYGLRREFVELVGSSEKIRR